MTVQPVTIGSRSDWATALLSMIQAPVTQNNVNTLVAWETAEGGAGPQFNVPNNVANYNPLNVTETYGQQGYGYDPGTGKFYAGASPTPGNQPPVASFPDWNTGLSATSDRLQEPFASGILNALRSNASEGAVSQAVAQSGWGTGNFSGAGTNASSTGAVGPQGSVTNTGQSVAPQSGTTLLDASQVSTTSSSAGTPGIAGNVNNAQANQPKTADWYYESIVPEIPGQPPHLNPLGLNPIGDLASVLTYGVHFGGWAIFTLLVLLFGLIFLGLGLIMLIVLLVKPVASPIASVVGGKSPAGRIASAVGRSSSSSPPEPPKVDETANAQHVARGAHAPGASGRTRSTEAVRTHKNMIDREERAEMGHARANRVTHAAHGRAERKDTRSRTRDQPPGARSRLTKSRSG